MLHPDHVIVIYISLAYMTNLMESSTSQTVTYEAQKRVTMFPSTIQTCTSTIQRSSEVIYNYRYTDFYSYYTKFQWGYLQLNFTVFLEYLPYMRMAYNMGNTVRRKKQYVSDIISIRTKLLNTFWRERDIDINLTVYYMGGNFWWKVSKSALRHFSRHPLYRYRRPQQFGRLILTDFS